MKIKKVFRKTTVAVGAFWIAIGVLATPFSMGVVIYDMEVNDETFRLALQVGLGYFFFMSVIGLGFGFFMFYLPEFLLGKEDE